MAQALASTTTTLVLGSVTAEVALLKTTGDPVKLPEFVRAGPSGGALRKESRLVYEAQVPKTDPLAISAESDAETGAWAEVTDAFQAGEGFIPAEYRDVLVEEGSNAEVREDEVRRGIRDDSGVFIDLTEHLARIDEETKLQEMEVAAFIRVEQVPRERVTGSYYLASSDGTGAKVLRLVYEAMRKSRRVAVVRWTKRTRQALGVIVPHAASGALLVLELSWEAQWRTPPPRALSHLMPVADVSPSEIEAAVSLVDALADSRAALDEMEDDAVRLRTELVDEARELGATPGFTETGKERFLGGSLEDLLLRSAETAG